MATYIEPFRLRNSGFFQCMEFFLHTFFYRCFGGLEMMGPISKLPEHPLSNLLCLNLLFKFDRKNLYYFKVENSLVEILFLFFDYVNDLRRLETIQANSLPTFVFDCFSTWDSSPWDSSVPKASTLPHLALPDASQKAHCTKEVPPIQKKTHPRSGPYNKPRPSS